MATGRTDGTDPDLDETRAARSKHLEAHLRLMAMHAPTRQVAFSVLRIGLLVGLAMLLILGLLPAVLGVEAANY
jgi:hypothetical protein